LEASLNLSLPAPGRLRASVTSSDAPNRVLDRRCVATEARKNVKPSAPWWHYFEAASLYAPSLAPPVYFFVIFQTRTLPS
jgi:hypothetical protein